MFAQRTVIQENPSDVMCLRFSMDDSLLCAGCYDGQFRCYNAKSGKVAYTLTSQMCDGAELKSSITAARFRPGGQGNARNMVLLASGDGITHWHIATQRMQAAVHEPGNLVYALDYSLDGGMFASAGKDCMVRVYDDDRNTLVTTLMSGVADDTTAHTNRIQSVKWVAEEPSLIVSGGWDSTIQIWDMREGKSVRNIYGPYLCGDGLDVSDKVVLAGSTRDKENVECFDLGSGKRIGGVTWPATKNSDTGDYKSCQVFSACFGNKTNNLIVACGTQDLKIFDRRTDRVLGGDVAQVARPLYACHTSRTDSYAAFGGAGGTIYLYEIQRGV